MKWQATSPSNWRRAPAPQGSGAAARAAEIIAALRAGGSAALARLEAGLRQDPMAPLEVALAAAPLPAGALEVPAADLAAAPARVPADLADALVTARARLRRFLAPGLPRPYTIADEAGNSASSAVVPLERVGVYAPGGRAPYPSSVLMAAVPARLAGVPEVVLCTPAPDPGILAAAAIAGVDRVFLLGPVQAVAAMAWGLDPVPRCAKVVGPGGPYVVEAKRQLFGETGIDGLPGPSELVVLATPGADPVWVAADLLAQAEHGPDTLCLLVTTDAELLAAVGAEVRGQAESLPARRRADALAALDASGGPVLAESLEAALGFAAALAPEHISLQGPAAEGCASRATAAGAVFVGPWSPVAAGDYAAGTDHILPTAQTARFASGLSTADFVRRVQIFRGSAAGAGLWAPAAERLARAEGFSAHAASLELRRQAAGVPGPAPAPPPYVPPVPPGAVRLDLNENPLPWPQGLWDEVLAGLRAAEPTRYPRQTERLQAELAAYAGVDAQWCLPANGSDELLLAVVAAWGPKVARAIFPVPTFGMYRRLAEAAGIPTVGVPLGPAPGFALPVQAILEQVRAGGDALVFLCRPNNPTGTLWPARDVAALVEAEGVWAVVDEAYIEFSGDGLGDWLADHPRLCLLRTCSKAFALAGLRVGYALGRPDVLAPLRAAIQPWAISTFSAVAAFAALGRRAEMEDGVALLKSERERLFGSLATIAGITPYPSRANYILFEVAGRDAFTVFDELYDQRAVLRRWRDEPALRNCLRVSVGRPEENDRVVALLRAAMA